MFPFMPLQIDDEPYASVIGMFVKKQFPCRNCCGSTELVDMIADEVFGTKSIRYGPKPSPESQVNIRNVIRERTKLCLPIPFMVPWGSEKPDGSSIDIAELSALRVLRMLNERISAHYKPGAVFNIRIEDTSAPYTLMDDPNEARRNAYNYTTEMQILNHLLGVDTVINMVPESSLTTEAAFNKQADELLPIFTEALWAFGQGEVARAQAMLADIGWSGGLNVQLIDHYVRRYNKLYPTATYGEQLIRVARYFATSLTRKKLGLRGDDPAWGGHFVELSFAAPVPSTVAIFDKRVYYRTIPGEFTMSHMPPWRAKGYLSITNDNEVTPKLASFADDLPFVKYRHLLSTPLWVLDIQADYILE